MKIELKNIKHAAFASEETYCFSASVLIDGVKEGEVSNDGHGGSHRWHPWALAAKVEKHAKTLPVEKLDIGGGEMSERLPTRRRHAEDAARPTRGADPRQSAPHTRLSHGGIHPERDPVRQGIGTLQGARRLAFPPKIFGTQPPCMSTGLRCQ